MISNNPSVELKQLTKMYGQAVGVQDVSFSINPGEVLGFLGPNGAGKTTTMRLLTGLIAATSGTSKVLGFDSIKRDPKMLARIGYLPGALSLYKNMTAWEYLDFVAKIRRENYHRPIRDLAQRFELNLNKHIHDLSHGNRQKVGVIQAFMHSPDVLFLDEPTSGLDPLAQKEFETLLNEVKARGAAVLLSSHIMTDVEHLADRVAIINLGRLVLMDEVSKLKQRTRRKIELSFKKPMSSDLFSGIDGVRQVESIANRVVCSVEGAETKLLARAVELDVESVLTYESSLEDIFFEVVGEVVGA